MSCALPNFIAPATLALSGREIQDTRYHDQDGAMGNDKIYKGSCFCGEVQLEVSGQPASMNR